MSEAFPDSTYDCDGNRELTCHQNAAYAVKINGRYHFACRDHVVHQIELACEQNGATTVQVLKLDRKRLLAGQPSPR